MCGWALVVLLLISAEVISISVTVPFSRTQVYSVGNNAKRDETIDASLYSRQLFVYGEKAQLLLKHSSVLVFGDDYLNHEIVKNIALSGVGRIIFASSDKPNDHSFRTKPNILGPTQSLVRYTSEINRNVVVEEVKMKSLQTFWSDFMHSQNITVVVASNKDFHFLKSLDQLCRKDGVKLVACDVQGTCGFVFNDFLRGFIVADADGEERKEVVLSNVADIVESDSPQLRLESIEEQALNVGIGESVEILNSLGDALGGPFKVIQVVDMHCIIVSVPTDVQAQQLQYRIQRDGALVRKVKSSALIHHLNMLVQLMRPSFCPGNACLAPKKDRATSLCLLACFLVRDSLHTSDSTHPSIVLENTARHTYRNLRAIVVAMLQTMGVADPELSLRQKGEVGAETIDRVVRGFFAHTLLPEAQPHLVLQCPATAATVGAIAAQEVIKAVTHMYTPVRQFWMVEGLDCVPDAQPKPEHRGQASTPLKTITPTKQKWPGSRLFAQTKKTPTRSVPNVEKLSSKMATTTTNISTTANPLERLYGADVVRELQSLRVFVVGAGAIGSEVLKNLALLGVGSGAPEGTFTAQSGRKSMWATENLLGGGIVVTDMDQIERSNLNRQLLFRDKHIGQYKSHIAAQQIALLNAALHNRVRGLTLKVGTETEAVFDAAFWKDTDVVISALDNVEARQYVDSMCVKHCRWLLDSGTLGTKGNTQVVIPHLTESYGSSADPAEEALPLCTLKSFPYQPEHCVAWAKSRFEAYFSSQVQLLTQLRELLCAPVTRDTKLLQVRDWLGTLSADQMEGVLSLLQYQPWTVDGAQKWAQATFHALYHDEATALLQEHPAGSTDDDGVPFWGGSRRLPVPISFDPSDPVHSAFVTQVSTLLQRVYRTAHPSVPQEFPVQRVGEGDSVVENILSVIRALPQEGELFESLTLQAEEFEKDDAALGHVSVVTSLSNLRSRLYGIKELSHLEVQKVAGNIIPALATTTSLVSGLVTLELVKIAAERVRYRREQAQQREDAMADIDCDNCNGQLQRIRPFLNGLRSWLRRPKALTISSRPALNEPPSPSAGRDISREYLLRHKSRLLSKFRNAFANLARPMLAFAEPVEAEHTPYSADFDEGETTFTMWDTIEAPASIHTLTIQSLSAHLLEHYGVELQSASYGDALLYADFLPDSAFLQNKSIRSLLISALQDEEEHIDASQQESSEAHSSARIRNSGARKLMQLTKQEDFILLEVSVTDEADEEGREVAIPKVKVYLHPEEQPKKELTKGKQPKTGLFGMFSD